MVERKILAQSCLDGVGFGLRLGNVLSEAGQSVIDGIDE
jgi:hypothetical protein